VALYRVKKSKVWLIKAVDRGTGRTVAWVLGHRDAATFQRLYDKVKHLKDCLFYTDDWDAFATVLPPERHIIGKAHTVMIERDNSNTRHHLGRMTRRTKVVSKKVEMVDASIKLWLALTTPDVFRDYQQTFLSIFI
jgi:insertion element IS1 protein InsB